MIKGIYLYALSNAFKIPTQNINKEIKNPTNKDAKEKIKLDLSLEIMCSNKKVIYASKGINHFYPF